MTDDGAVVQRVLLLVARQGLAPADPEPWPILRGSEWDALIAHVQLHRIAGCLAAAVHTGALSTTDQQRSSAYGLHAATVGSCLRLERMLGEVLDLFDRHDVEHRVLKGPSFAALDYPDRALRIFGDIDVLVRAEQFDVVGTLLSKQGYRRHFPEIRPGFDRRYGKGASYTGPTGLQLDLHRTFSMGAFGLAIPLQELWAQSQPFNIAGRQALALGFEHRLLHACFHAALGRHEPQLVPLRDLAGMLLAKDLDFDALRPTMERWRAEPVVAAAVLEAKRRFGTTSPTASAWAAAYVPTPRERRALRSYSDPDLGFAARQYSGIAYAGGPMERARYASALLFPGRSYGSGRHRNRALRLATAAREIRRVLRRANS